MSRTIVALSTPAAAGALAVVRLSGDSAVIIADKVFKSKSGRALKELAGYRALYGGWYCEGEQIDEGVALVFRAPKSYTGEDMVEFSCHGSMLIAERIIAACIAAGAKPAEHGEFTRRAFENGKLDLTEAEAVAELIAAQGEGARRAALARRNGAVSRETDRVCEELSLLNAKLAVWSDYPEETDAPVLTAGEIAEVIASAKQSLTALADSHRAGKFLQSGVTAAIVGKPNVGKSTLLNRLTGSERAIVTDIPGTTRDVVEAMSQIGPIAVRFLDTAGIRETSDAVEAIGVSRAREVMRSADVVLLVTNAAEKLDNADRELIAASEGLPVIIIENKCDLPEAAEQTEGALRISAKEGEGIKELSDAIIRVLGLSLSQNSGVIASERQYDCVIRAIEALAEALEAVNSGMTFDAAGILVDDALDALGEMTGTTASALTLEQVFSKFCVGK